MRLEDLADKMNTLIVLSTNTNSRLNRIEDSLSKKADKIEVQELDERVRSTESFTSRIKGAIGILGLAWTVLITWLGVQMGVKE